MYSIFTVEFMEEKESTCFWLSSSHHCIVHRGWFVVLQP